MSLEWLMLIYTVPSQPSRYRAYVWRELKRAGAIYLRDGVALLPRRPDLEQLLAAITDRVQEYEGTADLVCSPQFAPGREKQLVDRFLAERESEYREVYHACVRFLRDVLNEVSADEFGFPDVDNLESELHRLRRWYQQIEERDYFASQGAGRVAEILEKCERAFERFVDTASERGAMKQDRSAEDVFDRLGGHESSEPVPEDFPI